MPLYATDQPLTRQDEQIRCLRGLVKRTLLTGQNASVFVLEAALIQKLVTAFPSPRDWYAPTFRAYDFILSFCPFATIDQGFVRLRPADAQRFRANRTAFGKLVRHLLEESGGRMAASSLAAALSRRSEPFLVEIWIDYRDDGGFPTAVTELCREFAEVRDGLVSLTTGDPTRRAA